MSDSRLEKFIYAICSMDVSDLPVPLSRIETLWNCLITGETPDFEPLSRNEKYLMAMLDRYDISNLPAPMSRGEKLLYKIAVGETDLSDVPGYLSRYEELLKYLIENGGISGGDFEYVLYTLNQSLSTLYLTAEKPVKSAILSGNTLVNISPLNGEITLAPASVQYIDSSYIQKNKTFTFMFNCTSAPSTGFIEIRQVFSDNALKIENINVVQGYNKFKLTTVDKEVNRFRLKNESTSETDFVFNNLLIIEGDYTNVDIPYFEGMASVKMPVLKTTGKNLLPRKTIYNNISFRGLTVNTENNRVRVSGTTTSACDIEFFNINTMSDDEYIKVKPNTKYILSAMLHSGSISGNLNLACKSTADDGTTRWLGSTFTTKSNESKVNRIRIAVPLGFVFNDAVISLQLEESTVATSYEPYKSNILTVNEEVELRGIGDVHDELNVVTGELTQRIEEIIIDGNDIAFTNSSAYMAETSTAILTSVLSNFDLSRPIICNDFPTYTHTDSIWQKESNITSGVSFVSSIWGFCIRLPHTLTGVSTTDSDDIVKEKFKTYLQSNPITIQYHLETESVKTVDLTVVDQDNQPTELGTFENLTHVSLEAENLIPEVEMEVATIISEELASASPLMDDISTDQQQLSTTIDEQSENVDATMIATTEIFEEIL